MNELAHRNLGTSGLDVSQFILGAGVMGGMATITGPGIGLDQETSHVTIDRALELGLSVIDTADVYTRGESERIVGAWLATHPDAPVLIETKTGMTPDGPDLSPDRIRTQLQKSLETLGRVDIYLAHAVDPSTDWSASLPVFSDAVDAGLIRAYGLSNVTERDLTAALEVAERLGLHRPSVIQNRFSLIARGDEDAVLPLARAESLAYTPYSPLAAGLLSGRYVDGSAARDGSRLSTQAPTLAALEDSATLESVRRFTAVAERHELAPATLAYAWLINQPGVTAPIVGVSKPSHWDSIIASTQVAWTEDLATATAEAFAAAVNP